MGDLTFSNIKVGENESGLVHWCDADVSDGETTKTCHVEFIDMPLTDGNGKLRMDAVGSMLVQKFYEPEFVGPVSEPVDPKDIPEIGEIVPIAIKPAYLAERKAKLVSLQSELTALSKTIVVKDVAPDKEIIVEPIVEPIKDPIVDPIVIKK